MTMRLNLSENAIPLLNAVDQYQEVAKACMRVMIMG